MKLTSPQSARMRVLRDELACRFPACFAPRRSSKKPLAIGIHRQLTAAMPDTPTWLLHRTLADYVGGVSYLESLVPGAERVCLDGKPAGTVTEDAAAHAAGLLAKEMARRHDNEASQRRRAA